MSCEQICLVYGTDVCKQIWQILVVNAASEDCTPYFKGLCPKVLLRYSFMFNTK